MKRDATLRFLILIAGLAAVVFLAVFVLTSLLVKRGSHSVSLSREKIAVIEIHGVIIGSKRILKSLKKFSEDRNVKGIILRIDSPGGAVAPSQEIYSQVRKIHEKGEKKIVASFGNVAASGAYYVASATDRIVSNPGTITGSIGVIMEMSNIEVLLDKIGVESYVVKSGDYKDMGSMVRAMSEEEQRILQSVLNDVHRQFIEDVAKGRGMDLNKVQQIADGRIFSGRQALGLGLVDDLGSFEDAVDVLKELTGIEGDPTLIYEKKERLDWIDYFAKGLVHNLFPSHTKSQTSGAFYLMR
jgi:protease-4